MPPSKSVFYLSVSELAAAAGRNKWRSQEQVLADCYRKKFPVDASLLLERLSGTPLFLAREAVQDALASQRFAQAPTEENATKRLRMTEEVTSSALKSLCPTLDSAKKDVQRRREEAADIVEALRKSATERGVELARREADEVTALRQLRRLEAHTAEKLSELVALEANVAAASLDKSDDYVRSLECEVDAKKREALQLEEQVSRSKLEHDEASQTLRQTKEQLESAVSELRSVQEREREARQREKDVVALASEAPSFVKKEIKSAVQTRVGISQEARVVRAVAGFEPAGGSMVYGSYTCGGYRFRFGGKCDGKETTTGDLLEVKIRQTHFRGLPEYEEIQVLAYLLIYDKERCFFREALQGEVREDRVVTRDDAKLRSLIDGGLLELMRKWEQMRSDEAYCLGVLGSHPARV